jgi:dihydroxyacetone synthase
LGDDDVAHVKKTFGFDPTKKFHIPEEVYGTLHKLLFNFFLHLI